MSPGDEKEFHVFVACPLGNANGFAVAQEFVRRIQFVPDKRSIVESVSFFLLSDQRYATQKDMLLLGPRSHRSFVPITSTIVVAPPPCEWLRVLERSPVHSL